MDTRAQSELAATVSAVIVRACVRCGGKREAGAPCAGCGNPEPPVVHDLGVQSAFFTNPVKQAAWVAIGQHRAARRAARANREVSGGDSSQGHQ